jgi:uncharacterized protein (DUF2384 family)
MKRHSSYLEPDASRESAASSPNEHAAAVLARAVEVIGDKSEAMRWMATPVRRIEVRNTCFAHSQCERPESRH